MRIQIKARNRAFDFSASEGERILYAGLRAGIDLPYECATGTCGTCKAKLVEGEIRDAWADAPGRKYVKPANAEYLMCQCIAETDVTLEVSKFVNAAEPAAWPPASLDGVLARCRDLTHDVRAFSVELPRGCDFEAGQFMAIATEGLEGYRAYSMVNYERGARSLDFVVKRKPGGGFSEWLFSGAREGAPVKLFGPLGKATYYPALKRNVLCIAGGSGIAGMMSILRRAVDEGALEEHRAWLFFGVRAPRDVFYLRELSALREQCPDRLQVTVALSDEAVPDALKREWPRLQFEQGLVHEVAKKAMQGQYQNARAYVAGPPPAVDAALRVLLLEAKLTADNIRYDKFS